MLAPVKALFLGCRNDLPVNDERCGSVVENRVDPENVHALRCLTDKRLCPEMMMESRRRPPSASSVSLRWKLKRSG
jgi:hypothetical protein